MVDTYDALKNHQQALIRKALKGSLFIGGTADDGIDGLTEASAATAGAVDGSVAAVNIVTGGNLVVKIDGGSNLTTALADADTPAACVTKINTAIGSAGTASLVSGVLHIVSATTGTSSSVTIVSGTGTVLSNLKLTAGQTDSGSAASIGLLALPTGWDDLGLLSGDGVSVSEEVSKSDVTSWGYTSPTRSDVLTDTTTLTCQAQETKLLTLGIYTGQDMSLVTPDAGTSEVRIDKPSRPRDPFYKGLLLAVDESEAGEIFIGRYFPKIKRASKNEQKYGGGDEPISYGMTFQTYVDDDLGFSESWLFGGTGWAALTSEMGF